MSHPQDEILSKNAVKLSGDTANRTIPQPCTYSEIGEEQKQIERARSKDLRKESQNLKKLWQSNRQQLGPSDPRTVRYLFELCRSWKNLNTLRESIRVEAPYIMTWTVKARNVNLLAFLLQQKTHPDRVDETGARPLMTATRMNHAREVRMLLDGGADVQWPEDSETPLHVAATKDYSMVLEYLLDAGMNVESLDHKGNSALFYASYQGCTDSVKILLTKGSQVDYTGPSKIFPLHAAVSRGYPAIVELLLDAGADIHRRNHNLTPVLVAINYDQDRILQDLLRRGAEPNPSLNADLAIHFATRKGFPDIITTLLDAGVAVDCANDLGFTALSIAAAKGNSDIVDRLLCRGASVHAKSKFGRTPLHEAAEADHSVMIEQLLRAGADHSATTVYGSTPMHYAASKGSCEGVSVLLSHHADPTVTSGIHSVLELAVRNKSLEIVKRLVRDCNVDVNVQSTRGWSSLQMAASSSNLAMVDYLLAHGAIPELADNQGHTPLQLAASAGSMAVVERLISCETVDVDRSSMHGLTPLHLAALKGNLDIAKFLLAKGANTNALFLGCTTPLSIATWGLHTDVASLLMPLTRDPLLLDCYGRNCFDWASRNDSLLVRLRIDARSAKYIPTEMEARREHALQLTRTLIDGLLTNCKSNDMRFTVLARNLLFLHDVTEAENAYQLGMFDHITGPLLYTAKCDMCEKYIQGDIYLCTECADKDLCDACIVTYKDQSGEVKGCVGHTYHGIVNRHWEGMFSEKMNMVNTRGMRVDEWLRHVKAAYTVKVET